MNDDDIRAFGPEPRPTLNGVARRRRRLWPWLLGGLLVLALLAAGALAALWTVTDSAHHGMHVIVNGQPWDGWSRWDGWDGWDAWDGLDGDVSTRHGLVAGLGAVVAVLVVLFVVVLVVPFTVLLGLLLGLMGLAIGLATTVGAVGLVAAVVLSPLWGLGLLLWLIFRRRSAPTAGPNARMAA
jgi:hypothetical protein